MQNDPWGNLYRKKNHNNVYITELFFYIALIINFCFSIFYSVYTVLHEYYSVLLLIFSVIFILTSRNIRLTLNQIVVILALMLIVILIIWANGSGIGLLITIIWPMTIIYIFMNSSFSKNYLQRISLIVFFAWLLAIMMSFQYTEQYFENFSVDTEGINPNTISIIITISGLWLNTVVNEHWISKRIGTKVLKFLIGLITFYGLIRTNSRTSIIAFLVVIVISLVFKERIIKSSKFACGIYFLVILLGIGFPVLYVYLFNQEILSYDAVFIGKNIFTGRQLIWMNLWDYLQDNPLGYLVGIGYNTEIYSEGTFNMHNSYLQLIAQYGVFLFLGYCYFLYRFIISMYRNESQLSKIQLLCFQSLIYMLIVGTSETILLYLPNLLFWAMIIGIEYREKKGIGYDT